MQQLCVDSLSLSLSLSRSPSFIGELIAHFPHEEEGIRQFYAKCWDIFNALNSMELKSLEELRCVLGVLG